MRAYIIPNLGHKRLDKLTSADCAALWVTMSRQVKKRGKSGETLSSGTIHTCRRVLRACLAEAQRRGLIGRNPAADARPMRLVTAEINPLDRDEAQQIIAGAASRRNGARWVCAIALGLRSGEARGLCWDDVDLDGASMRVRRAIYRGKWEHGCTTRRPCGLSAAKCPGRVNGGLVLDTPKSASGTREFTLPAAVVAVLRQHRKAQAAERLVAGELWVTGPFGGFVFATPTGHPMDIKVDWLDWQALQSETGVRPCRPHDLRHTAATIALLSGTPDRVVMQRLGWSSPTMLARYQHVLAEADQAAAAAMDTALFGLGGP